MEAYREWRVVATLATLAPRLQSSYMLDVWHEPTLTADMLPDAVGQLGSVHGVHAVKATAHTNYLTSPTSTGTQSTLRAQGAVDVYRKVIEHEDGVVRAEHCRVLALQAVMHPIGTLCECGRLLIVQLMGDGSIPLGYGRYVRACRYEYVSELKTGRTQHDMPPARSSTTVVHGVTTLAEVEQQLRLYYEVPRLPDAVGPWFAPPPPPVVAQVDDE